MAFGHSTLRLILKVHWGATAEPRTNNHPTEPIRLEWLLLPSLFLPSVQTKQSDLTTHLCIFLSDEFLPLTLFSFWDRVSLYITGCLWTCNPPVLAFQVPGLWVCTTFPDSGDPVLIILFKHVIPLGQEIVTGPWLLWDSFTSRIIFMLNYSADRCQSPPS